MPIWTFYPAFVGTFISVVAWTYFARKEHLRHLPRTLSELGSDRAETLRYYRTVLWVCGPLFAITMFAFVVPRIEHTVATFVACVLIIGGEVLVGVFPARHGTKSVHDVIAGVMSGGMIALAYVFAWSLTEAYAGIELLLAISMTLLGLLCLIHRKRYLFYELPLIFLSHFSILVAAVALRA